METAFAIRLEGSVDGRNDFHCQASANSEKNQSVCISTTSSNIVKLFTTMIKANVSDVEMVENGGSANGGSKARSASGAGKSARSSWERIILYVLVGALAAFAITYPVTRNAFEEEEKTPTPTSPPTSPSKEPIDFNYVIRTNNPALQWRRATQDSVKDGHTWTYVWGTLRVPLLHGDSNSPDLNLRVSVAVRDDATAEDAKHPLISHCGGPGSSDDCAIIQIGMRTGRKVILGILQRGMDREPSESIKELSKALFPGAENFPALDNLEVNSVVGDFGLCWDTSQTEANLRVAKFPATNKEGCECWLPPGDISYVKSMLPAYNALPENIPEMEKFYAWQAATSRRCYDSRRWKLVGKDNATVYNYLDYIGTGDLARDIETLRLSMSGVDTLDCHGVSYGTGVFSVYSATFPKSVRRVVLDGNIGSEPGVNNFFQEAGIAGNQIAYEMVSRCERMQGMPGPDPTGGCKTRGRDFVALFREMRIAMDRGELNATMGDYTVAPPSSTVAHVLSNDKFRGSGISTWMEEIFPGLWGLIDRNPAAIESGIRKECRFLEESRDCWDGGWLFTPMSETNVVRGLDYAGRFPKYTAAQLTAQMSRILGSEEASYARDWTQSLFAWPAAPAPQVMGSRQDVKALVIGNSYDPATPFYNAKRMRDKFPNGVLVTYQGGGHGVQPTSPGGKYCKALVDNFLQTGQLPLDGTVCRESDV